MSVKPWTWACACGWRGRVEDMAVASHGFRVCPAVECGASGGLVYREHDLGPGCWCGPSEHQACPEGLEVEVCPASCWRCAGESWVAPWSDELPVLVVHVL